MYLTAPESGEQGRTSQRCEILGGGFKQAAKEGGSVAAKRSERKRQRGAKAFAIVLFMAAGAAGGYLIGRSMDASGTSGDPLGTVAWLAAVVVLLTVSYLLQIVVHEAGHLALGLATGYRFRSFRVGSYMLVEQDGRLHLKRLSIQGTGGQCLKMCIRDRCPSRPGSRRR